MASIPAKAGAEAEVPPTPLMVKLEPWQSWSAQTAHRAWFFPAPANSETSGRSRTVSTLLGGKFFCHEGFAYPAGAVPLLSPALLAPPPPATMLVCPEESV